VEGLPFFSGKALHAVRALSSPVEIFFLLLPVVKGLPLPLTGETTVLRTQDDFPPDIIGILFLFFLPTPGDCVRTFAFFFLREPRTTIVRSKRFRFRRGDLF